VQLRLKVASLGIFKFTKAERDLYVKSQKLKQCYLFIVYSDNFFEGQFLNQTIYMFLDVWEMQFRGKGNHFVPLVDSSP